MYLNVQEHEKIVAARKSLLALLKDLAQDRTALKRNLGLIDGAERSLAALRLSKETAASNVAKQNALMDVERKRVEAAAERERLRKDRERARAEAREGRGKDGAVVEGKGADGAPVGGGDCAEEMRAKRKREAVEAKMEAKRYPMNDFQLYLVRVASLRFAFFRFAEPITIMLFYCLFLVFVYASH
jgi:hypothetical protein